MFMLDTWPNEIVLFVVLNELVALKQLLLKESTLLEGLLLSPTRDCDILLFCCSLGVADSVYCGGFGERVLEYDTAGSIDRILEAEEKRGCCFLAALLANAWPNQLMQNMLQRPRS